MAESAHPALIPSLLALAASQDGRPTGPK